MPKLSDRIRPNCEAAPWVIEEIKRMEASFEEIDRLAEAGLCSNTFTGVREFIKDIREKVAETLKIEKPYRE